MVKHERRQIHKEYWKGNCEMADDIKWWYCTSYFWRPPEGVTGTVRVVSLGSCEVRICGIWHCSPPCPLSSPPLSSFFSRSESTSSMLTAGWRPRLQLSVEVDRQKKAVHLGNYNREKVHTQRHNDIIKQVIATSRSQCKQHRDTGRFSRTCIGLMQENPPLN